MRRGPISSIFTAKLTDGRSVRACSAHFEATYRGMLEGEPFPHMNDMVISRIRRKLQALIGPQPVHMIEPERREVPRPGRAAPAEYLPPYWVAVDLRSSALTPEHDYTHLTLVWFKDEPSWPSETECVAALNTVDWKRVAGKGSWTRTSPAAELRTRLSAGRRVVALPSVAGSVVSWDRRDASGRRVAAGVYSSGGGWLGGVRWTVLR